MIGQDLYNRYDHYSFWMSDCENDIQMNDLVSLSQFGLSFIEAAAAGGGAGCLSVCVCRNG